MNDKGLKEFVGQWRKEHPYGHRCDLYNSGMISRSSVDRYWNECSPGTEPLSATDRIRQWRAANPDGSVRACVNSTGISRSTVYSKWEKTAPTNTSLKNDDKTQQKRKNATEPALVGVENDGQLFFLFDE